MTTYEDLDCLTPEYTELNMEPPPEYFSVVNPGSINVLSDFDRVDVTRLMNREEVTTLVDKPRRFTVANERGNQMFSLLENASTMYSHSPYRSFQIDAVDPSGTKAFSILREESTACAYCCLAWACFSCCKTRIKIKRNDKVIGTIVQDCSFLRTRFTVYRGDDQLGDQILRIEGNDLCCNLSLNYGLRYPKESRRTGNIRKKGLRFGGFSNSYTVIFPAASDPELKVLCIAAVVFLDFMYFNKPVPRRPT